VLFVTYGGAHIAKVAPVVFALRNQNIPCTVIALTLGYKKALQWGLCPLGYKNFMHLVDHTDQVMALGKKLLFGNQHPDVEEYESICYLGVNYMEWVQLYGEAEAEVRYLQGGRRHFLPINFFGQIIDYLKPNMVVSTSSPRSEQAAIVAASLRHIPTLTMMDLFALPYEVFHRHKVKADRITVLSDFVKQNLVNGGTPPEIIHVTGCPSFDIHFETKIKQQAQLLRQTLGWNNLQVVMWAGNLEESGPEVDDRYIGTKLGITVETCLREWINSRTDLALIVRYHPSQYHLFQIFEPHQRIYVSNPGCESVEPLLHLADTLVVQASTVGYEASMIGKRVLSLVFSPMVINSGFNPARLGYAEAVCSPENLIGQLETARPFLMKQHLLPPAGPATPRVIEHILCLLQAGRSLSTDTGQSGL
jgi:hypothetical protein